MRRASPVGRVARFAPATASPPAMRSQLDGASRAPRLLRGHMEHEPSRGARVTAPAADPSRRTVISRLRGLRRISGSRWAAIAAVAASLALLPPTGLIGAVAPAQAAEYPTWADVEYAVAQEQNTAALVAQITGQLAALEESARKTQAEAEKKGAIFNEAQQAADEAGFKADKLQGQADQAQTKALAAQKLAARLIAASSKVGGSDLTANLLGQSSTKETDNLLYKLGAMDKITDRSNGIYTEAVQLQNSAQSLTDQANEAKAERDRRQRVAEEALEVAQAAADKAADALEEQRANKARLDQQLVVLAEKRAATQADYEAGLVAQWGPGAAGIVSPSGFAKPANGYISSQFGMRLHPIYGYYKLHSGTDIAGTGCGAPIFATHSGTVTYSGPNGDLGNYIQIDHGDGTSSGYGHIIDGGLLVRMGDRVGPGQNIAKVGSTGGSTGCHLHFMIRINGSLTDPVGFLRDRGVELG